MSPTRENAIAAGHIAILTALWRLRADGDSPPVWDHVHVSTDSTGPPAGSDGFELTRSAGLWFILVGLVGFLLVGFTRGWRHAFETGEMSVYLLGLTLAVLGEIAIELIELGDSDPNSRKGPWTALWAGLGGQLRGDNTTGRTVLAAVLPLLLLAAGNLSGLAPSTSVPGLSITATRVINFVFGVLALAAIRFVVRRQPAP